MTIRGAQLLDEAWALYAKIASEGDDTRIARQSASWLPLTTEVTRHFHPAGGASYPHISTPYDFAAALVKSLFPEAYNYPAEDVARTDRIWDLTVEAFEVLGIDDALYYSSPNYERYSPSV